MWRELEDVLSGKLDLDPETLPVLRLYHRHATWVEAEALAEPVCRDPDDDMVLATAIAGEADVMVTGDEDLLVLGSHAGISILSPRQFLMAQ
jgi:putative PIN family toxin of toxin-antitoxin system